jgi:hypothetical protein
MSMEAASNTNFRQPEIVVINIEGLIDALDRDLKSIHIKNKDLLNTIEKAFEWYKNGSTTVGLALGAGLSAGIFTGGLSMLLPALTTASVAQSILA